MGEVLEGNSGVAPYLPPSVSSAQPGIRCLGDCSSKLFCCPPHIHPRQQVLETSASDKICNAPKRSFSSVNGFRTPGRGEMKRLGFSGKVLRAVKGLWHSCQTIIIPEQRLQGSLAWCGTFIPHTSRDLQGA